MRHFKLDDAAVVLAGTKVAREYFEPIFQEREQELTIVALCDATIRVNQLLSFPGDRAKCEISLREVIQRAVHCDGIIVAHNHPSGSAHPGEADLRLTRTLCDLTQAINVTFLDHLIFGGDEMFSFRQKGLI